MQQFFLSRAAGDDDSYAVRFFRDLSAKVAQRSGIDTGTGFVDVGFEPGIDGRSPWSAAAWDALTGCQAFVALCSPRYFLNDRCGREWGVFAERLRRHREASGTRQPALFPVVWSGTAQPAGQPRDGEEPTVRQLVRLHDLRPRYQAFLDELADQIVAALRAPGIPRLAPEPDPATVANPFDLPDGDVAATGPDPDARMPDPRELVASATRHVHFVVAAGTRREMADANVRTDLQFYGERREDWAPYRPALPEPLAGYARRIAALRLFGSDVASLSDLSGRLDRARRNNEIVVLLVDSWITQLPPHRQTLAVIDDQGTPSVAVLAPANTTDPESARHRGQLSSGLRDALPNLTARGDQLLRLDIDDTESFAASLVAVLEEAQNRVFRHGRVFRLPASDAPAAGRPILEGP